MTSSLIFVFLDGFGLGASDATNPLYLTGIPSLESLTGSKIIAGYDCIKPDLTFKGVDATLGVDGLPQSATGQTALFTGTNAPAMLGYHLPAFPNQLLIDLIREKNILKRVVDSGLRATFANAYSANYFERAAQRQRAHSVTTHCVLSAGLPFRTVRDLLNGKAITWDITREYLNTTVDKEIKQITPQLAGYHLSQLAADYELVLFESFSTDLIGHRCSLVEAEMILGRLNMFFEGLLNSLLPSTSIVICSDHGNIEDLSTGSHTMNQVPLLVWGSAAPFFEKITAIDQVEDAVHRFLYEINVK